MTPDELSTLRTTLAEMLEQRQPVQEHPLKRYWQTITSVVTVLVVAFQLNVEAGRIIERINTLTERVERLETLSQRVTVIEERASTIPKLHDLNVQLGRIETRLQALEASVRKQR